MRVFSKLAFLCILVFDSLHKAYCVPLDLPYSTSPKSANEIMQQVYFVNHFYSFKNLVIKGKKNKLLEIINFSAENKLTTLRAERFVRHHFSNEKIKTKDLMIIKTGKLKGTGLLATDYTDENVSIKISLIQNKKLRNDLIL